MKKRDLAMNWLMQNSLQVWKAVCDENGENWLNKTDNSESNPPQAVVSKLIEVVKTRDDELDCGF